MGSRLSLTSTIHHFHRLDASLSWRNGVNRASSTLCRLGTTHSNFSRAFSLVVGSHRPPAFLVNGQLASNSRSRRASRARQDSSNPNRLAFQANQDHFYRNRQASSVPAASSNARRLPHPFLRSPPSFSRMSANRTAAFSACSLPVASERRRRCRRNRQGTRALAACARSYRR